jgi:hypothetical protein
MRAVRIEAVRETLDPVTVAGLEDVPAQVGGYVQPINLAGNLHLLVDEDGGDLPFNMLASMLAGEPIVGNALVIGVGPEDWVDDPAVMSKVAALVGEVDEGMSLAPCSPFVDHVFQRWAPKCLGHCGTENPEFDPDFDPWGGSDG